MEDLYISEFEFTTEELPADMRADVVAQWDAEDAQRVGAEVAREEAQSLFNSRSERDEPVMYICLPRSIASGSQRLTAAQAYVYMALAFGANRESRLALFTQARLAEAAGVGPRSIPRILALLEHLLLIERADKGVVVPVPEEFVRIPADALWSAPPRLNGSEPGGAPLMATGSSLRALGAILIRVDWKTWQCTASHESLATNADLALSQFRDGLKALQSSGLVVLHPDVRYRVTAAGVRRQVVPLRVRWSAALEWTKTSPTAQPKVKKELSPTTRLLRQFIAQHGTRNHQERGQLAVVIKEAVAKHGFAMTERALKTLGRDNQVVSSRSVNIQVQHLMALDVKEKKHGGDIRAGSENRMLPEDERAFWNQERARQAAEYAAQRTASGAILEEAPF